MLFSDRLEYMIAVKEACYDTLVGMHRELLSRTRGATPSQPLRHLEVQAQPLPPPAGAIVIVSAGTQTDKHVWFADTEIGKSGPLTYTTQC
jgi:hypothetical protein